MSDARLGIVRLPLPDGRSLPLQLTFATLDQHGHSWIVDQLNILQRGKAGSQTALAELLEAFSNGHLTKDEVMKSPLSAYPLALCIRAIREAWDLAQHGPDGREAAETKSDPRKRPPTWWARTFGKH